MHTEYTLPGTLYQHTLKERPQQFYIKVKRPIFGQICKRQWFQKGNFIAYQVCRVFTFSQALAFSVGSIFSLKCWPEAHKRNTITSSVSCTCVSWMLPTYYRLPRHAFLFQDLTVATFASPLRTTEFCTFLCRVSRDGKRVSGH